jgi:hypothetical protein
MLGKVAKNVGLAPWEREHLKQQRRERQEQERTSWTRGQWHSAGYRVTASDAEAVRSFVIRGTGRVLYLFSSAQVVAILGRGNEHRSIQ